ncbi:MAG: hypothetical protein H7287_08385 [Thermoleophilia bacterium]|nr:hypothetical protein [Thermoleophilia bacterium]
MPDEATDIDLDIDLDLDAISQARGPWEVDVERADRDAEQVLRAIDFARRDIFIWAPGTRARHVHPAFRSALRAAQPDAGEGNRASLTPLLYEASWHIRRSAPTGMLTLKRVLQGIRTRLAASSTEHNVYLAGESQGAWIIGEMMADADVGDVATRAVLMGHPMLAGHEYVNGEDDRVVVINNQLDQVTLDVRGDPSDCLDAMIAMRTLQFARPRHLPNTVRALTSNWDHVGLMLLSIGYQVPRVRNVLRDPHDYSSDMARAVDYLYTGELSAPVEWIKPDPITVAHELAPKLGPKVTPHVARALARRKGGAA